ncbi:MAG TPA: hypothetical protein VF905_03250 [Nitrospirota bacterium]
MIFREAKVSKLNPPLSEEARARFLYEFANLCHKAVCINSGRVVDTDEPESMYAMAYFMGWKWRPDILMEIAKRGAYPEMEFVDFVHDMVIRLGLVKFEPSELDEPGMKTEFERLMKGRCSFTRTTDGKYAFAAQIAYETFCKVIKLGQPNVK